MALRMYRSTTVGNAASAQTATAFRLINAATDRSLDLKTLNSGTGISIADDAAGNLTVSYSASGAPITGSINGDIKRTSAAVTANATTTYADVTGLTATLVAGATYAFRVILPSTVASGTGGIKYCFNYTSGLALTSLQSSAAGFTASAVAVQNVTSTTAQADLFTQAAVVIRTVIEGTMVVNTGGTITVQMAQNTSNASNTVALVGGSLELTRIA